MKLTQALKISSFLKVNQSLKLSYITRNLGIHLESASAIKTHTYHLAYIILIINKHTLKTILKST